MLFFEIKLFLFSNSLWNRVVSAAAPRVATQYAPQGKPTALYRTVFYYGFLCVLRAGGSEPACGGCEWRDALLVEFYQKEHDPADTFLQESCRFPQNGDYAVGCVPVSIHLLVGYLVFLSIQDGLSVYRKLCRIDMRVDGSPKSRYGCS